jgi:integrase
MRKRKYPAISVHETLSGQLKVNWEQEYINEFSCPYCNLGRLSNAYYKGKNLCHLVLRCDSCRIDVHLTDSVHARIYRYCPDIECPNPLCTEIGHDGQKGWIYNIGRASSSFSDSKCYFCGITFKSDAIASQSWIGNSIDDDILPFDFDADTWDLKNFFENPSQRFLYCKDISPEWYCLNVKKYLHYLLKIKIYSSSTCILKKLPVFRQFGFFLNQHKIEDISGITRESILGFLDDCRTNKNVTINRKLSDLKYFFEWLELEASNLVLRRDFLKVSSDEVAWLDEVTRTAIKQHLPKIPAFIARHYLIQEYTAARVGDVCQMSFECLVEEDGKWYIMFFQQKTKRWQRIPATREIRQVVEEQQQWIRQTLGLEYSYLFCHFRTIKTASYPNFFNIKPLPSPPKVDAAKNPMTRIIRMLIENENIFDANGQKPHFTGKITRPSRLQEIRVKHGIEAAQLYADHKRSRTTFQHYTPPTREQVAEVDLPFQKLLMNPSNKFLPWQSLPESLLKNPKAHELDLEIAPRLVVYGHCALDPKTPCPVNLYPKCYGCSSFRPSTAKLPLYERQYQGEQQRLTEAEKAGAELAQEEAKATIEAMDKWLPELRRLANG